MRYFSVSLVYLNKNIKFKMASKINILTIFQCLWLQYYVVPTPIELIIIFY